MFWGFFVLKFEVRFWVYGSACVIYISRSCGRGGHMFFYQATERLHTRGGARPA